MKKNMSLTDRGIRFILLITFVTLYFTNILNGTLGIIALVVSVIFFVTSLIGYCPLYKVLGIQTCSNSKKEEAES